MKKYQNNKGKNTGHLTNGVYLSKRNEARHMMKMMGGAWGVDSSIVNDLINNGCQTIRITTTDTKKNYTISMRDFLDYSVTRNFRHGDQMFVSKKYWTS